MEIKTVISIFLVLLALRAFFLLYKLAEKPKGVSFICPKCGGKKVKLVLSKTSLESKQVCPDCGFESKYSEWF